MRRASLPALPPGVVLMLLSLVLPSSLPLPTSSLSHTDKEPRYRRVCYYTNWSQYRKDGARFLPANIDPFLCTHIIFAFAKVDHSGHLAPYEWNDIQYPYVYRQFTSLKKKNPALKTLLAVGGWTHGSGPFTQMVRTRKGRQAFLDHALQYLRTHQFDGLDLDWEYPANRGSPPEDKDNFSLLLKELREGFEQEAARTGKPRLLLTAAVAGGEKIVNTAYDVPKLDKYLDFINLMSYDLHGSWSKYLGHNAPLYGGKFHPDEATTTHSVDESVQLWLRLGASRDKLVMGVPLYGRSFTLCSQGQTKPGDRNCGAGQPAPYTREKGFVSYYEMEAYLAEGWQRVWVEEEKVPYAFHPPSKQWVGYDDITSIKIKAQYIKEKGLGGAMVWALDLDDFAGLEHEGDPYPLCRALRDVLTDNQQFPDYHPPPVPNSKKKKKKVPTTARPDGNSKSIFKKSEDFKPDFPETTPNPVKLNYIKQAGGFVNPKADLNAQEGLIKRLPKDDRRDKDSLLSGLSRTIGDAAVYTSTQRPTPATVKTTDSGGDGGSRKTTLTTTPKTTQTTAKTKITTEKVRTTRAVPTTSSPPKSPEKMHTTTTRTPTISASRPAGKVELLRETKEKKEKTKPSFDSKPVKSSETVPVNPHVKPQEKKELPTDHKSVKTQEAFPVNPNLNSIHREKQTVDLKFETPKESKESVNPYLRFKSDFFTTTAPPKTESSTEPTTTVAPFVQKTSKPKRPGVYNPYIKFRPVFKPFSTKAPTTRKNVEFVSTPATTAEKNVGVTAKTVTKERVNTFTPTTPSTLSSGGRGGAKWLKPPTTTQTTKTLSSATKSVRMVSSSSTTPSTKSTDTGSTTHLEGKTTASGSARANNVPVTVRPVPTTPHPFTSPDTISGMEKDTGKRVNDIFSTVITKTANEAAYHHSSTTTERSPASTPTNVKEPHWLQDMTPSALSPFSAPSPSPSPSSPRPHFTTTKPTKKPVEERREEKEKTEKHTFAAEKNQKLNDFSARQNEKQKYASLTENNEKEKGFSSGRNGKDETRKQPSAAEHMQDRKKQQNQDQKQENVRIQTSEQPRTFDKTTTKVRSSSASSPSQLHRGEHKAMDTDDTKQAEAGNEEDTKILQSYSVKSDESIESKNLHRNPSWVSRMNSPETTTFSTTDTKHGSANTVRPAVKTKSIQEEQGNANKEEASQKEQVMMHYKTPYEGNTPPRKSIFPRLSWLYLTTPSTTQNQHATRWWEAVKHRPTHPPRIVTTVSGLGRFSFVPEISTTTTKYSTDNEKTTSRDASTVTTKLPSTRRRGDSNRNFDIDFKTLPAAIPTRRSQAEKQANRQQTTGQRVTAKPTFETSTTVEKALQPSESGILRDGAPNKSLDGKEDKPRTPVSPYVTETSENADRLIFENSQTLTKYDDGNYPAAPRRQDEDPYVRDRTKLPPTPSARPWYKEDDTKLNSLTQDSSRNKENSQHIKWWHRVRNPAPWSRPPTENLDVIWKPNDIGKEVTVTQKPTPTSFYPEITKDCDTEPRITQFKATEQQPQNMRAGAEVTYKVKQSEFPTLDMTPGQKVKAISAAELAPSLNRDPHRSGGYRFEHPPAFYYSPPHYGFECPTMFGIYADPHNCHRFYQCVWMVAFHHVCGPGTVWNDDMKICDWPTASSCRS